MKRIAFLFSFLAIQLTAFSQLGVGTNSPDASAQLDVTATDKGFLAPRIALTSATDVLTIASPATGLMIYNTATAGTSPNTVSPGYYYFDGVKWVKFSAGDQSSKWTNDAANSRVNLTNLSDGTTPRTGATNFTVTDNNVLQIGDMSNIPNASIPERGIIVRKTGNASITSISDGGGYSVFENQIYGGSVSNSATYNVFAKSRGSLASPQAVLNGDLIGVFDFRGFSGTSYANSARIMTRVDGTVTNNSVPVSFDFQTIGPTETAPSSRLRIASNGNVGIGTTSPATKLEISSGISGISGLRFTNLTSSSAATSASSKVLAVNSSGDLILTNVPGTQNIVSFNTADPNSGSPTFTPNSPIDQSVIYQSATNNSLWIYNGSTYVTYTAPTTTPFFLASTSNDAGSNKTLPINRTGSITVDNGFVRASNSSSLNIITIDPTETSGPRVKLGTTSTINSFLEIGAYNSQNNFDTKNRDLQFFGTGTGNSVGMILKANTGFIGIGTVAPVSTLSNTSLQIQGSNFTNAINGGLTWVSPGTGFVSSFYNSVGNGLLVKIAGTSSSNHAFEVSTGSQTATVSSPLFSVRGNGTVGINVNAVGNATPLSTLHVVNPLIASNTINADASVLRLARPINSGVKWDNIAQFNLGSYSNGGSAQSRLDLSMNNLDNVTFSNIMTWQANGNVGIGSTAPATTLHVQNPLLGTATINADAQVLQLSRTGTPSVKWDNIAQFNLGSFSANTAADTRLDLVLNNTTTTLNTTPTMTWHANGRVGVNSANPASAFDVRSLFTDVARFTTSQTGASYAGIGIGNASGTWAKIAAGNDRFEIRNFTTDAVFLNVHLGNGNVGIGTTTATSKLEVNGSATNSVAYNAGALTTIDFSLSNLAYTAASAGAFSLTGIKNGGTYTLAVQGDTSGSSTFSCSGFTFIYVNNGITAPNKDTLYTFIIMGPTVYVYMATGF